MKWFLTGSWRSEIEVVEVERFTDKSVWVNGRRKMRAEDGDSGFYSKKQKLKIYHQTWGEAEEYLRNYHIQRVERLSRIVRKACVDRNQFEKWVHEHRLK